MDKIKQFLCGLITDHYPEGKENQKVLKEYYNPLNENSGINFIAEAEDICIYCNKRFIYRPATPFGFYKEREVIK